MLSHLFEPLTSTPIKGTKAKKMNEIINNGVINFFRVAVSIIEIKSIINKANKVKIKCLEKKK